MLRSRIIALALLVFLATAGARPANAGPARQTPDVQWPWCNRGISGSPWFEERASVGAVALPPGVAVEPGQRLDQPISWSSAIVTLRNTSPISLYLLRQRQPAATMVATTPVTLPASLAAERQIADSQLWHWEYYSGDPAGTWRQNTGTSHITIDRSALDDLLPRKPAPEQRGDNRPANAAPPPDLASEITLLYGTEFISIPVTLTYRLNPGYEPRLVADYTAACEQANAKTAARFTGGLIIGAACLIVGIIGFVWLVVFIVKAVGRGA